MKCKGVLRSVLALAIMAAENLTPMMRQYLEIRDSLPKNTMLLFRLGDFYEMFGADAELGSKVLGITLTKRHHQLMAGIPYHAGDTYIEKILKAGYKVAICEQTETPKTGKLVQRAVVRILTPGTTLEEDRLATKHNHFLLGIAAGRQSVALAWLDLSTGAFQIAREPTAERLLPILHSLDPKEVVLPERMLEQYHDGNMESGLHSLLQAVASIPWTEIPDYHFDALVGEKAVKEALGVMTLDGFGIASGHEGLGVAGALVYYATEMLCSPPQNLFGIREYRSQHCLLIDPATQRNLEIFRASGGGRKGSLLEAMDATTTAAGGRLLEQMLSEPGQDIDEIERRQDVVEAFLHAHTLSEDLVEDLARVYDIQRILGRIQNRIRNPRELGGIRATLGVLPSIRRTLEIFSNPVVQALAQRIEPFAELKAHLESALSEELPGNIQEGGVIRSGFDAELDRLRSLNSNNKSWISDLETSERERTGIKNLKVKFNGAFGYFIEVTKANLDLVPDHYIRKQTMVNAERFYTEDLKLKEREILHAEEMSLAREEQLFNALVETLSEHSEALMQTAAALAEVDVFLGWAQLSRDWDYCKPEFVRNTTLLEIEAGRHPVIEQALRDSPHGLAGTHAFVPNHCQLQANAQQIALITGPNMAGKSTYIRQNALIVLMAHVGCWVPAASCRLGCIDRIFSRVGASDELARGNSTFMVEMNETANILNHATARSLVILDEIGRGTSTYDGLSIAWAVVEYLHGDGDRGPMTLFATHYHELTQLHASLPRLKNLCVAVKEWNDEIIFVRQVIDGAADRSYGIQVARLAGLPRAVIQRAQVLLEHLESDPNRAPVVMPEAARKTTPEPRAEKRKAPENQLSLFAES
ncbi:MAG: DNA mismatch repair protein MutS [Puniceicoccaceae bacterium]